MNLLATYKRQVFNTVIFFYPVKMMNTFIWSKMPIYILFHYKTMFINISIFVHKWVTMFRNQNISVTPSLTSLPTPIFLSFWNYVGTMPTTKPSSIITLLSKRFSTSFACAHRKTICIFSRMGIIPVFNSSFHNQFSMASIRASSSLAFLAYPMFCLVWWYLIVTNNAFHSSIIPQTINYCKPYYGGI